MLVGFISIFFFIFHMGLESSSNLYFDLDNDEVFVNYKEHLRETSEFDTHQTIKSRKFKNSIIELTNTQDSTRYNIKRLKKLLVFL